MRVQGSGFRVQDLGFRVWGLGLGSGLRVKGLRAVKSVGLRV